MCAGPTFFACVCGCGCKLFLRMLISAMHDVLFNVCAAHVAYYVPSTIVVLYYAHCVVIFSCLAL